MSLLDSATIPAHSIRLVVRFLAFEDVYRFLLLPKFVRILFIGQNVSYATSSYGITKINGCGVAQYRRA